MGHVSILVTWLAAGEEFSRGEEGQTAGGDSVMHAMPPPPPWLKCADRCVSQYWNVWVTTDPFAALFVAGVVRI